MLVGMVLRLTAGMLALAQSPDTGMVEVRGFDSAELERAYAYTVYLPAGYADSQARYPVIYLLHGRGDKMDAWLNVRGTLDRMIAAGELPPVIAVMPDFPSSNRGGYYVDSLLDSMLKHPEAVETAFLRDLIPHIDATFRTVAAREGRAAGEPDASASGSDRAAAGHVATLPAGSGAPGGAAARSPGRDRRRAGAAPGVVPTEDLVRAAEIAPRRRNSENEIIRGQP